MKISPSKGAGIIFYKILNGNILVALGKRNEPPFKGSWSFAGGNFDITDVDLYTCTRREKPARNSSIEINQLLRLFLILFGVPVGRCLFIQAFSIGTLILQTFLDQTQSLITILGKLPKFNGLQSTAYHSKLFLQFAWNYFLQRVEGILIEYY